MYLTGCHRSKLERTDIPNVLIHKRADIPNVPCALSVGRHDLCMTKFVDSDCIVLSSLKGRRLMLGRSQLRVPLTRNPYSLLFRLVPPTHTWHLETECKSMARAARQETDQKVPVALRRLRLSHCGQSNEIDERHDKVRGFRRREIRGQDRQRRKQHPASPGSVQVGLAGMQKRQTPSTCLAWIINLQRSIVKAGNFGSRSRQTSQCMAF